MIDYNWFQLHKSLIRHSEDQNIKELNVLFNYAWMVVDNIDRFTRIYEKLPSASNHKNLDSIKSVRIFRNTFAHLDERIDEIFLQTHTPFFGTLSWVYKDTAEKKLIPHVAISGINYGVQSKFKLTDYSVDLPTISNIQLQSSNKNGKNSIFIDELIIKLKSIVNETELHMEKQFIEQGIKRFDWSKQRDILLKIESIEKLK